MIAPTPAQRRQDRLTSAFRAAETDGLEFAVVGRLCALLIIALWQAAISQAPVYFYYDALIALFAVSGLMQIAVSRMGGLWRVLLFVFVLVDAALMTVALVFPNPLADDVPSPAMFYHFPQFGYFYLLPVLSLLSLSPPLVLWAGVTACIGWGTGLVRAMAAPETLTATDFNGPQPTSMQEAMVFISNPQFIDVVSRIEDMIILMIVTGLLALAVSRMRRLVRDQADTERARANLARYFSPNMVDELAEVDSPFGTVRTQSVAVLFADIVGFTRQCEERPPAEAIELLRGFHRRMEQTIFAFGGTLDKFLGDGVMATFGTPRPGSRDAANALACARAMIGEIDAWNHDRRARGQTEVRIGIGVHSGPVVLGDVGSSRHLEFAVIGDTVNIASRLESLTRQLKATIVISEHLAQLTAQQGGGNALVGFSPPAPQTIRGRADPLSVLSFQ
jgi:adenylate cyclase